MKMKIRNEEHLEKVNRKNKTSVIDLQKHGEGNVQELKICDILAKEKFVFVLGIWMRMTTINDLLGFRVCFQTCKDI